MMVMPDFNLLFIFLFFKVLNNSLVIGHFFIQIYFLLVLDSTILLIFLQDQLMYRVLKSYFPALKEFERITNYFLYVFHIPKIFSSSCTIYFLIEYLYENSNVEM